MIKFSWFSGKDNYLKHTFEYNHPLNTNHYIVEALDVDYPEGRKFDEIIVDNLSIRQTKFVEVLYSGGMDSEVVLQSCLRSKIPVKAITMKLQVDGTVINTHDLYYSEKFCRNNNINQTILDIDVKKFIDSGNHFKYLKRDKVSSFYPALNLWTVEQCTGFPVMGGNNFWPVIANGKVIRISPRRYEYFFYDKFFTDNNIHGIGDMLSHSLDINILIMKTKLQVVRENNMYPSTSYIKHTAFTVLGNKIEPRIADGGWTNWYSHLNKENVARLFDPEKTRIQLTHLYGKVNHKIIWNKKIAGALNISPGECDNIF